ncbi:unnamed protein product [Owenia fusiformis]|uniref:Uncharacterized protein n=1 Tax=Owenia fusiformis TaxID=6347 RepID=A0A8J1TRW2_OWEFU|nr:unnamed protein product [Owenia fusiformis]
MPRRVWLLVVAIVASSYIQRATCEKKIRIGFLGCKFSAVCRTDEVCINDRLFGNCQPKSALQDNYKYFLDLDTLKVLEEGIYNLILSGLSWESFYTQCVLQSILVAYRTDRQPDLSYCNAATEQSDKALDEDALQVLADYFKDYYDDINNSLRVVEKQSEDYPDFNAEPLPYDKKDELVNLHKYQLRGSDGGFDVDNILALPPKKNYDTSQNYDLTKESQNGDDIDLDEILENADPRDLFVLRSYLSTLKDLVEESPAPMDGDSKAPGGEENVATGDEAKEHGGNSAEEQQSPISKEEGADIPATGTDNKATMEVLDKSWQRTSEEMSPKDAKMLQDLMAGKVNVDLLTDDEVDRLTRYVTMMLREEEAPIADDEAVADERGGTAQEEIEDEVAAGETNPLNLEYDGDTKGPVAKHKVTVAIHSQKKSDVIDQHDHTFEGNKSAAAEYPSTINNPEPSQPKEEPNYNVVDTNYAYIKVKNGFQNEMQGINMVEDLAGMTKLPQAYISNIEVNNNTQTVTFKVNPQNPQHLNASIIASQAMAHKGDLLEKSGLDVQETGLGQKEAQINMADHDQSTPKYFVLTFVISGCIAGVVIAVVVIYLIKRHTRSREKLQQLSATPAGTEGTSKDYSDLCRQHMQTKASEKPEPLHVATRIGSVGDKPENSPSSRSSTSSWSEEPVISNMDISTGHIVLSYMEDHLKNKDRLDSEWEGLCRYEAEPNSCDVAKEETNQSKNRYADVLPYDHSRVVLNTATNIADSDYINASSITDHDPRNPAYIATQGPLPHTVADFWQMVWEQGSVVIVMLGKMTDNGVAYCHRYWPEEGSDLYHIYEVHLVSEHIWCDDYLVRSFYLKNLQTNETRTVTQFHFLSWPDNGIPSSAKALLDFRRKVNKSYRGRSCPIVVHCSDGMGRTGTYSLIDMVLNRMAKGAKEIDIAATLEHIRDQRMSMVKTKEQFEFVLSAVAEEVHAILKALPQ